jgi:hypothetical protein
MKKEEHNFSEYPVSQMEEQFPHPLPCATAHEVATGHPVSLIHVMHESHNPP